VPDVLVPLFALRLEEVLKNVLAERLPDHVVFFKFIQRIAEIGWQIVYA
jgi:hypothetical protein